ncbi:major facilitator superfamily domain-containing protein [Lipomyces mesembrius]
MTVATDNLVDSEKWPYPALDTSAGQQKESGVKHVDLGMLAKELDVDPRKLMWKIDVRLMPMLCILYLMAFLDRVNIANAALFGMKKDLDLTDWQPLQCCSHHLLCTLYSLRGSLQHAHEEASAAYLAPYFGIVQNYSGLLATRFFLGIAEAGMFPGCFYLIAMWGCHVRHCSRILLPHRRFPEDAKFLTVHERAYVKAKIAADVDDSQQNEKTTVQDILEVFKDYKLYLAGFMYFGLIVPAYGYAYFAPAIINQLGYSTIQTQLHSVPPWVAACGASMISSIFSDYFRHRYLFTMGLTTIAIVGFGILLGEHHNVNGQYAALFLCALGLYASMPIIVCWTTTNFGGHSRRGIGTGWQVGFGNIGGITATFSFLATDAPRFTKGYSIGLAFAVLSMISCTMYLICTQWENRQRDKGIGIEQWERLSDDGKAKAGDKSPYFRYGS